MICGLTYNYTVYVTNKIIEINSVVIKSSMEEKSDVNNFNKKLQEVANSITGNNEYDIAKSIHDYVCKYDK